jgi:septal ring factor EnvC (AmiA/AmiB activator)
VPRVSLLADAEDSEGKRASANAGEVLRLDALLLASNSALDRQTAHIHHLETLVAERDRQLENAARQLAEEKRQIAERDRINAVLQNEIARLHEVVNAKDRMVSYRQSFRWWLALPWMRFKLWLEARH